MAFQIELSVYPICLTEPAAYRSRQPMMTNYKMDRSMDEVCVNVCTQLQKKADLKLFFTVWRLTVRNVKIQRAADDCLLAAANVLEDIHVDRWPDDYMDSVEKQARLERMAALHLTAQGAMAVAERIEALHRRGNKRARREYNSNPQAIYSIPMSALEMLDNGWRKHVDGMLYESGTMVLHKPDENNIRTDGL